MAEQPTDHGHEPAQSEHRGIRYERTDIRLRLVLALVAGAACFAVLVLFVIWQFFRFSEGGQQADERSPYSRYTRPSAASSQLPPEPRLEPLNSLADVNNANVYERLAGQEKILHSYGPTDDKGFVHIPIDRAIQAVAGHLPVRTQPPGANALDQGLIDSGKSASGPILRGATP